MQMLAGMTAQQLRDRTRAFAKSVVHLCLEIPAGDWVARVLGTQTFEVCDGGCGELSSRVPWPVGSGVLCKDWGGSRRS
jgi:hypothetical protein